MNPGSRLIRRIRTSVAGMIDGRRAWYVYRTRFMLPKLWTTLNIGFWNKASPAGMIAASEPIIISFLCQAIDKAKWGGEKLLF